MSKLFYEPSKGHGLVHDPLTAIVGPRPIGWVTTQGADGSVNLAPYSFFNAFNFSPPIIGFSSVGAKDSLRNVQESGEFVWNATTRRVAEQMRETGNDWDYTENEFVHAGLEAAASRLVAPPRVAASPVNFECKVSQIVQLKSYRGYRVPTWLVLGEVIGVHIDEALIVGGEFNTFGAEFVLRAGGNSAYARITPDSRFDMRPKPEGLSFMKPNRLG
ncbi:Flavin reductase like domain protein [Mycobacterium lentiflavum]|uniref:Flavin reductase like domain protein n=1 Tax=Mycobacterium lentiflavum TaxID=141349 RepID=A0A0E4GYK8_MYCLN|nr:flavin reductase family protein [Mycobacterium lentiflavum]CQD15009.1 Flavin reductase like domain protein [Mycobacterium lentiflavum]